MIERNLFSEVRQALGEFPTVGIIGPRQVGKTTLARRLVKDSGHNAIFLDMENPEALAQLSEPSLFLRSQQDKLVVLDEVQRKPEIFPLLRVLIDEKRTAGRFLILGSASPELLRQSSESLAGRISYHELAPLIFNELDGEELSQLQKLHLRGGFPPSFLAASDSASSRWRTQFLRTYTERDLPMLGFAPDPPLALRFLQMVASAHAQIWNAQAFGKSLGLTHPTVNKYRDFLENAFLLRVLKPYHSNLKKRLVKSPKVYIRDSGLLHNLLRTDSYESLLAQAWSGFSWEGFAIENILQAMPDYLEPYFVRTHEGAEIDLLLTKNDQPFIAIEIKFTNAPKLPKGFVFLIDELETPHNFIITPSGDRYPKRENVEAISLGGFLEWLGNV